ncbi:MAG: hypothetical protein AB7I18_00780 [Candidatus Berkiella sp.]
MKADIDQYLALSEDQSRSVTIFAEKYLKNKFNKFSKMVDVGMQVSSAKCTILISLLVPDYFIHQTELTSYDFTTRLQLGESGDRSALRCLAEDCDGKPLLTVLEKRLDTFTAADFTAQIQEGPGKGTNVLWMLAHAAWNGKPEALLTVLKKFPGAFTAADFTVQPQEGYFKGKSALGLLVDHTKRRNRKALDALLALLELNPHIFSAADFIAQVQEGDDQGKGKLWLLAKELDKLVTTKRIEDENGYLKMLNKALNEQLERLQSNGENEIRTEAVTEDSIVRPYITHFQSTKRLRESDAVSSDDDILQPPTKKQNRKMD